MITVRFLVVNFLLVFAYIKSLDGGSKSKDVVKRHRAPNKELVNDSKPITERVMPGAQLSIKYTSFIISTFLQCRCLNDMV